MKIRLRGIVALVFMVLLFVSLPLIFSVWKKSLVMEMNKGNAALREQKRHLANTNLIRQYDLRRLTERGRIESIAHSELNLGYPENKNVVVIRGEAD